MTKTFSDGMGVAICYPSSLAQWLNYGEVGHGMCRMMMDRANELVERFYGKAEMVKSGDAYIVTLKVEKF
jgi:hypothetical protein